MWNELVSSVESMLTGSINRIQEVIALTNILSHTYIYSGAVDVISSTFCYGLFGGTYCETPTQLTVPVSFIQQTSAK